MTSVLAPGYRVLELGCGTGNVLRILEKVCSSGIVLGVDLFAEGLQYARARSSCLLVQGDVRALPFWVEFDLIGIFDLLEHLCNDMEVLRHIHAALIPGGVLVLTVPAHKQLWSYFDEASHHCRRYERIELANKLVRAGFEIEYLTYYMAGIFPLVWFGRRLAALIGRSASVHELAMRELRFGRVMNDLLAWLLSQEVRLITRRVRLPFGTSLLAVARKPLHPSPDHHYK